MLKRPEIPFPPVVPFDVATATRFWSKVAIGAPDACWPWLASTGGSSYGHIWLTVDGKRRCVDATCQKGDRVYVEGTLTVNTWQGQDGKTNTGLNIAAWKCERVSQIGRAREKRERTDDEARRDHQAPIAGSGYDPRVRELDDAIPF